MLLKTYNKSIDLAVALNAQSWVADNSIGVYFDVTMQRALAELSARRLSETKISRFARVVPYDVFQELVSHKIVGMVSELSDHSVDFELFTNAAEARNWALHKEIAICVG